MTELEIIVDDDVEGDEPRSALWAERIEQAMIQALTVAGAAHLQDAPLCLCFVSNASIRQLNHEWRSKDAVTDVLSFPMQDAPDFDSALPLGDIVLAMPFVADEAARLGLATLDHVLHLVIHGVLHLLAYDHMDDDEAAEMQQLERRCMAQLELHDPYPNHV